MWTLHLEIVSVTF